MRMERGKPLFVWRWRVYSGRRATGSGSRRSTGRRSGCQPRRAHRRGQPAPTSSRLARSSTGTLLSASCPSGCRAVCRGGRRQPGRHAVRHAAGADPESPAAARIRPPGALAPRARVSDAAECSGNNLQHANCGTIGGAEWLARNGRRRQKSRHPRRIPNPPRLWHVPFHRQSHTDFAKA